MSEVIVGQDPFRYRAEERWAKYPGDGPDGNFLSGCRNLQRARGTVPAPR